MDKRHKNKMMREMLLVSLQKIVAPIPKVTKLEILCQVILAVVIMLPKTQCLSLKNIPAKSSSQTRLRTS